MPEQQTGSQEHSSENQAGLQYLTAEALGQAVTDRIRQASDASQHSVSELRRQFAYDRFLARLFSQDPEGWVLKGGTALLARVPGQSRHSLDIDTYRNTSLTAAVADLRSAAESDIGDFFSFDVEHDHDLTGIHEGVRFRVVSYLGDQEFERFRIDLVVASNMTGIPEPSPPIAPITIKGLPSCAYLLYPLEDHIADKFAAMHEKYGDGVPSSRYRDLVDLVVIATTQTVSAQALHRAIHSEFAYRSIPIPAAISLPSDDWHQGFRAEANQVPGLSPIDATDAIEIVNRLLLPILAGEEPGIWDPNNRVWAEDKAS